MLWNDQSESNIKCEITENKQIYEVLDKPPSNKQ